MNNCQRDRKPLGGEGRGKGGVERGRQNGQVYERDAEMEGEVVVTGGGEEAGSHVVLSTLPFSEQMPLLEDKSRDLNYLLGRC